MVILALLFAIAPSTAPARLDFQLMTSPAYEAFARQGDAICPARKLRELHPADLDGIEETYLSSLTRQQRHRIKSLDVGSKGCAPAGASCPAQHMLAAIEKSHLLDGFVRLACTSDN